MLQPTNIYFSTLQCMQGLIVGLLKRRENLSWFLRTTVNCMANSVMRVARQRGSGSHNDMLCGGWQAHLLPQACRSSDGDRKSNLDLLLIFNWTFTSSKKERKSKCDSWSKTLKVWFNVEREKCSKLTLRNLLQTSS